MARKTNKDQLTMPDEQPDVQPEVTEGQPLSERSENDVPEVTNIPVGDDLPESAIIRRLRVNRHFSGAVIQERAIIPGVYYEDDPALFDLAVWLVEQQYAEWVG